MHRLATLALILATPAVASSDTAWTAFRADVEARCRALATDAMGDVTAVEVNPFGSERYGAAIVTTARPDGATDRAICIYDKQAKSAELTAPFGTAD